MVLSAMKHFYALSLIAAVAVTACAAQSVDKPCIPVPECPLENHKNYTVHVADPSDCHRFYKCDRGCGYLFECPTAAVNSNIRLVFNPRDQVCDWPENVPGACGIRPPITPPPITYPPITQPPITYPPITQPPITYPPITQPPITYPPITQPPITYPPITQPPITYPPVNPGGGIAIRCPDIGSMRIAHESNCQYFYDCLNGVKTLHQCNENLIFNPYVEACDYPIHVACIVTGRVSL